MSSSSSSVHTAFPTRASSSSLASSANTNGSDIDLSITNAAQLKSLEEISPLLQPAARFALADLISTILRLDFWSEHDPHTIFFCKVAFEFTVGRMGLPDKTKRMLLERLEDGGSSEDVGALIQVIREDELTKKEGRMVILSALLTAFVSTGNYESRYRVLLRHISSLLAISWDQFEELEESLAFCLLEGQQFEESEQARKAREKSQRMKKVKRYLKIGAAGGVGGVLIGLTGGIAAPFVLAGAGTLIGSTALAGLATTAGGAAIFGTAFGATGAGLTGYKMKKRVGAIEEFSVDAMSEGFSLHCALVVSGWIDRDTSPEEAFTHPWRHMKYSREQYTLRYESRYLQELGNAMDYLTSFAVSVAIQQTLMETALAGLLSAMVWPVTLLGAASVLDNPWNVCISRSTEVGEHLAEVLLSRSQGKRPISLIGFSLGARVLFHCLLAMSKRTECVGIVEDVILLGAPVTASPKQWSQISTVVGGRIINGYCNSDWLLRFLYRTMSVQFTIAGTGPIEDKANRKIVNYNLSHIVGSLKNSAYPYTILPQTMSLIDKVKGHLDYSRKLREILEAIGVNVRPHSEKSSNELSIMELSKSGVAVAEEAVEQLDNTDNLVEELKGTEAAVTSTVVEEKIKQLKDMKISGEEDPIVSEDPKLEPGEVQPTEVSFDLVSESSSSKEDSPGKSSNVLKTEKPVESSKKENTNDLK